MPLISFEKDGLEHIRFSGRRSELVRKQKLEIGSHRLRTQEKFL